ncbi:preprotein translocase subunit SecG [Mycoplasma sp. Ms02]|uniref:preprotein translocase subunit SecG n=1 Tax=Mycoplasma sp. Ms02 TaxID=353851 RepID=UPI001C8AC9D3|nr:preprotein translocase subunit SecG [Mycoplasma sp. Ms02]QZE12280.1 preprotein translocase subunit SecG [Mycoplasma sp. Ms02]
MTVIVICMIIIGFIVTILSLMMSPESNAFSGALVGSGDLELFKNSKERGLKKFLKYAMFISGFLLMASALFIRTLV